MLTLRAHRTPAYPVPSVLPVAESAFAPGLRAGGFSHASPADSARSRTLEGMLPDLLATIEAMKATA